LLRLSTDKRIKNRHFAGNFREERTWTPGGARDRTFPLSSNHSTRTLAFNGSVFFRFVTFKQTGISVFKCHFTCLLLSATGNRIKVPVLRKSSAESGPGPQAERREWIFALRENHDARARGFKDSVHIVLVSCEQIGI